MPPDAKVGYAALSRRIVFGRHGETAYNAEGRLQGQRDIPLNARGRDEAAYLGQTLRMALGGEIERLDAAEAFFASPLSRARETMELMRAAMRLPPKRYRSDPALMELSFGEWEGLTWDEIGARDPKALKRRSTDKWNFVPPGGESYAMLARRVEAWLAGLASDSLVVSHGGVARALMVLLAGAPPDLAAGAPVPQGVALIFDKGKFSRIG